MTRSSRPGAVHRDRERRRARLDRHVLRDLLAVAVDALIEIALPVQQSDRDERQPEVARGLAVVAGEHAEAARVDREALVQAEFGAEVRDQVVRGEIGELRRARRAQIRVERGDHRIVFGEIGADPRPRYRGCP